MPRSGTSWLGQIIDSSPQVRYRLSPLFSYKYKNMVDELSSKSEYEKMFQGAYEAEDTFMNRSEEREMGYYPKFDQKDSDPVFLAIKMTRFHNLIDRMVKLFDNIKFVSIVRHPCGAIHSWLTTPSEFPHNANPMNEWRFGNCRKTGPEEFWGFEDWKKVTHLHMKLEREIPDRFKILQYEYLVLNPYHQIRNIFDFIGLSYTAQTQQFIKMSQHRHDENPYSVFKDPSVKDRWVDELDIMIKTTIIQETENTDLKRFLV